MALRRGRPVFILNAFPSGTAFVNTFAQTNSFNSYEKDDDDV
jgi:hypothetical protein